MAPIDGGRRWWTVPVNAAATVAWRLPGALMGVILVVVAGSMLGPPGLLLALVWLVAALLTLPRRGERLLARTVLRYRPAAGSWLEAEVQRLLPGRRVEVYVAPKTSGVFALGRHTIALGEASIGAGVPTPALLAATAAAVNQLRRGPTRPELPLIWWAAPWWVAKQVPRHLLPRRWQPLLTLWAVGLLVASIIGTAHGGSPYAVVLTVCGVTDLCISSIRSRRQRRQRRRVHPQLQPAGPAPATAGRVGYLQFDLARRQPHGGAIHTIRRAQ